MKAVKYLLAAAALCGAISLTPDASAQDQSQREEFIKRMRERMMEGIDRMRDDLGVKDNDEWAIIKERIVKVNELRFASFAGGGFPGRGPGGGPPGGGDRGRRPGGDNNSKGGDQGGDRGGFRGDPNSATGQLNKALEEKASDSVIAEKLAKVRAERKEREAQAAKAQEQMKQAQKDLAEIVTPRQEAYLVSRRILE